MHYEFLVLGILLIYLTHRLENAMTVNTSKLDSAVTRLSTSVATELRQLAEAMTASDAPSQTIVDVTADKLNALADTLDADDAPVVEPPVVEPPVATPEAEHPEG